MAEGFDESALMIAIDLVEQGGMPEQAEWLRGVVRRQAEWLARQARYSRLWEEHYAALEEVVGLRRDRPAEASDWRWTAHPDRFPTLSPPPDA